MATVVDLSKVKTSSARRGRWIALAKQLKELGAGKALVISAEEAPSLASVHSATNSVRKKLGIPMFASKQDDGSVALYLRDGDAPRASRRKAKKR